MRKGRISRKGGFTRHDQLHFVEPLDKILVMKDGEVVEMEVMANHRNRRVLQANDGVLSRNARERNGKGGRTRRRGVCFVGKRKKRLMKRVSEQKPSANSEKKNTANKALKEE